MAEQKKNAQKKADRPKPEFDPALCVGCAMCVESCPMNCVDLMMPEGKEALHEVAILEKKDQCIGCGICYDVCPADAVQMVSTDGVVVTKKESGKELQKMANKAYVAFNRGFQAVMKVGMLFLPLPVPQTLKGEGALVKLPSVIRKRGISNVLVITDQGLMKLGLPDPLFKALEEEGIAYTVYADVEPNPTTENVEQAFQLYRDNGCQAIISMGGGSPMDCGKVVGAKVAHPRRPVRRMQGTFTVLKKIPPYFAIPTTAGTGSETTMAAVITDANTHHKKSVTDPFIMPRFAVLDPTLTTGLPPFITATTGLDALCHAVESYTNHTYNTMLENRFAKKAVRLIYNNLLKAYKDGNDLEARNNMQMAAFYAGRAFTKGTVGYVHAIGHQLGGLYGVPHGLAMSIILPHVMKSFGPAAYKRLAELADVCKMGGNTDQEKAQKFIAWIEQMKKEMNIPVGLDMIEDEDVDQIVAWAVKEANPLYPVPVIYGKKELKALIESMRV